MDGDFLAELVGGVDSCFDFVVRVGLKLRDVVVGASGGIELDDVGACGDLLADGAENFGDSIGDAARGRIEARLVRRAGDGESVASDEHAGPEHFAVLDEVAHGDVFILIGA